MNKTLTLNIPISKIDEEQRIVTGVATSEALDSQGDIMDYQASKKAFSTWVGNIREMHDGTKAIGKAIDVQFDDVSKQVVLSAYISKSPDGENAWTKVKEGILTGFSIGGRIYQVAKDKTVKGANRIVDYSLSETSLVDNPANPDALLAMVKSVDGHLQQVEEFKPSQPIHKTWWGDAFMPSIETAEKLYNKSMGEADIKKNVYGANFLIDLACDLNAWIESEEYMGEDVTALKSALVTIKQAAIGELQEADSMEDEAQDLSVAVGLATKAIDLRKDTNMADKKVEKAGVVPGTETRDADAEVTATAEENGRPLNDTEERAKENDLEPAVGDVAPVVADKKDEESEEEPKEEKVDVKVKEDKSDETEDEKVEEKSATVADLAKSVDTLIAKFEGKDDSQLKKLSDAVSAVSDKVEKSMASLEGRIAELEKQPMPVAAKASYVEVSKGDEGEDKSIDVKALLKRSEDAVAQPGSLTPAENAELFKDLRAAQKAGLL